MGNPLNPQIPNAKIGVLEGDDRPLSLPWRKFVQTLSGPTNFTGVASLNGLTGTLSITSVDSSVIITETATTVDLSVPAVTGFVTVYGSPPGFAPVIFNGPNQITFGNYTAHAVLLGNGISALNTVGPGTTALPLVAQGASADPTFAILTVPGGGTGLATLTAHNVLLGEGTGNLAFAAPGSAGQVLTSNGAAVDPTFQAPATSGTVTSVSLSAPLGGGTVTSSGTLGTTSFTAHGVLIGEGSSALAVTSAGTAGQVLTSNGASADPTFKAGPNVGHDAQTAVAGAATSAAPNVVVTSEALVAATTYTLTLTDTLVASTSIVQTLAFQTGGGLVTITNVVPASGSVAITATMAALTGTITFMISIFN